MPFLSSRGQSSRGFFGGGTVPGPPTSLSSIESNRQLSISFTAPAFNGGLEITNYEYSLATDSSPYSSWVAFSPADITSPVTIGNLDNGTKYYVKLRAVNILGGGIESDELSTNTNPFTTATKPTVTGLTPGNGSVYVEYSAPSSNGGRAITGYFVQHSSNGGATWSSPIDSGNDLNHLVTGLSNGTSYIFRVYAVTAAGNGQISDNSSASIPRTVPSQVGKPTPSSGDASFSITWAAPSDGGSAITGYKVQLRTNGSDGSVLDVGNRLDYPWSATNGSSYAARVLAYNVAGDGAWSEFSDSRTPTFAAPALSGDGSWTSKTVGERGTRRLYWTVNPTDVVGSTATTGTTTYLYVQWMTDSSFTVANTAEELFATYDGNQSYSDYRTSFTNSGTIVPGEFYRIRAVQYVGSHPVGTGWVNVSIAVTQTEITFNDWVYTNGVQVYETGTFNVNGGSFYQVSGKSIGGTTKTSGFTDGDIQYTVTMFRITATSTASASTATRYFRVEHSGTSTTLPPVAQTSSNSNTWSGAGNTSMVYDWNITNIAYGNYGAGRVAVDGLGASSWSPTINVVIEARGNQRRWTTTSYTY